MRIYTSSQGTQKVSTDTGKTIADKTGDATDLAILEITGELPATEKNIIAQIKKAYNESKNQDNISETMKNKLKLVFKDNISNVSESGNKIIVSSNVNGKNKKYELNRNTEEVGEFQPIDFGSKTKVTIEPGDDIIIGTEKFMVFSKTTTEIKAMPYYNLRLDSNPMRQATKGEFTAWDENRTTFSLSAYWTNNSDSINMNNSANNIQKYITAYKNALEDFGTERIDVRAVKYSELNANGVTKKMRNPGGDNPYWTGSALSDKPTAVWLVSIDGGTFTNYGWNQYNDNNCVRPIIIIPIN